MPKFRGRAVGERRLVILDNDKNRLLEYDPEAGETIELAEYGEDPGDLQERLTWLKRVT